jgi:two-component system alkaline phosphatase synthesis response regulator PhoP
MGMANETILVVEDESALQELLCYNLEKEGFRCQSATSGAAALEKVTAEPPSLILLDLMLPDVDGLSLCRTLRRRDDTKHVPIIMLTARGEEAEVVRGLESGADDYIAKPFNLTVLFARIRAVLRRGQEPVVDEEASIQLGDILLHPGKREVRVGESNVELTNAEFRLLHLLMRRPGWVFTRQQIVDSVWSEYHAVTERSVDVQVVGLRRKLGTASNYIETVRGVGYRFREA